MVSKGQFVGLDWNRITRLHSQVMMLLVSSSLLVCLSLLGCVVLLKLISCCCITIVVIFSWGDSKSKEKLKLTMVEQILFLGGGL